MADIASGTSLGHRSDSDDTLASFTECKAFWWFLKHNNLDAAELLLASNRANVDFVLDDETPLQWACREHRLEELDLLLLHGADVTRRYWKDGSGREPIQLTESMEVWKTFAVRMPPGGCLWSAAQDGDGFAMRLHLSEGVTRKTLNKTKPLLLASGRIRSRFEVPERRCSVEGLQLSSRVQEVEHTHVEATLMHAAACGGNTDIMELVLKHGGRDANRHLTLRDRRSGFTPLHVAACRGYIGVTLFLLHHGAKINALTRHGRTPLHHAVSMNHLYLARVLLEHGARVNTRDHTGETPLHYAARYGHVDLVRLLLEAGASVNARERRFGYTPLHFAARAGCFAGFWRGWGMGAGVGAWGWWGETALHVAVQMAPGVARMLVEHGADVRAVDGSGVTAVGYAIEEGVEWVVGELMGADHAKASVGNKWRLVWSLFSKIKDGGKKL
ncbi:hypothetical protein HDU96_000567 [Phlyctochytrium bullatum]|nr:hypothetical protein HDU96_000567 [Phlyctochytrium bullatum]